MMAMTCQFFEDGQAIKPPSKPGWVQVIRDFFTLLHILDDQGKPFPDFILAEFVFRVNGKGSKKDYDESWCHTHNALLQTANVLPATLSHAHVLL